MGPEQRRVPWSALQLLRRLKIADQEESKCNEWIEESIAGCHSAELGAGVVGIHGEQVI